MERTRGTPASRSDRDLVVAFKQGDGRAYDEIFRRHGPKVRVVCSRRLGRSHDAEEAVQETFLRAFQALPRFNGQYKLGAWLNRIAINVCIDQLRSRSHSEIVKPIEDADLEVERGPDEIVASRQPEVMAALHELKPLHAEALKLQAVHGLSHQEVAQQLAISPAQVKSLLHRARIAFKRVMNEASGFLLVPLAALRKGRKEGNLVPSAGAGTMNLMGVMAVAHSSWPVAERLVTGALVAALAVGGSTVATSHEHGTFPGRIRSASEARDLRSARDLTRPAGNDTTAPQGQPSASLQVVGGAVEIDDVSLPDDAVKDIVEPLTEEIHQELEEHKRKHDDDPKPPKPVDPTSVQQKVKDEARRAEEAASDTAEELLGDS